MDADGDLNTSETQNSEVTSARKVKSRPEIGIMDTNTKVQLSLDQFYKRCQKIADPENQGSDLRDDQVEVRTQDQCKTIHKSHQKTGRELTGDPRQTQRSLREFFYTEKSRKCQAEVGVERDMLILDKLDGDAESRSSVEMFETKPDTDKQNVITDKDGSSLIANAQNRNENMTRESMIDPLNDLRKEDKTLKHEVKEDKEEQYVPLAKTEDSSIRNQKKVYKNKENEKPGFRKRGGQLKSEKSKSRSKTGGQLSIKDMLKKFKQKTSPLQDPGETTSSTPSFKNSVKCPNESEACDVLKFPVDVMCKKTPETLVLTSRNYNTTKGDELIDNISNFSGQGTLDPMDPVKFLF